MSGAQSSATGCAFVKPGRDYHLFLLKKKNLEKFSTLSCSPLCVCVFTVHMFLWHYDSLFITILCAKIGPAVVGNERNNERIQKSFANLKSSH